MFETATRSELFEQLRLPVRPVEGCLAPPGLPERHPARGWRWLRWSPDGETRWLGWPRTASTDGKLPEHRLGAATIFGAVVSDGEIEPWLPALGAGWRRDRAVLAAAGSAAGSVWRGEDGSVLLPFDPDAAILAFWAERYRPPGGAKALARRAYYRLRPLLPRPLQIAMRRLYAPLQARASFPRWPVESSLHDLCDELLRLVAAVSRRPLPWIEPWPGGRRWALLLTHDVETDVGYRRLEPLRAIEEEVGCRSSWNFVPLRYRVEDAVVRELTVAGHEIGVHGLYHDGLDLESRSTLEARLPAIRSYAERWGAVGFRGPALNRDWELMPLLGFDYDSSYPDTDPHGPQGGGCCSWLPFFNRGMVELPVTMPQDHTVFEILGLADERLWVEKASILRERGGMANLIVHPDYMQPPARLEAYRRFVRRFAGDPTAWRVLPREASAWWRRRAESRLELVHGQWRVIGPAAAEATIGYAA